jgi:hypothetical protein
VTENRRVKQLRTTGGRHRRVLAQPIRRSALGMHIPARRPCIDASRAHLDLNHDYRPGAQY